MESQYHGYQDLLFELGIGAGVIAWAVLSKFVLR